MQHQESEPAGTSNTVYKDLKRLLEKAKKKSSAELAQEVIQTTF
jgi:hypothetical protein